MTDHDDDEILNPMVSSAINEDGSIDFEFLGETGGAYNFVYDNPELMLGVSALFKKGAYDSKAVQTGARSFQDVADEYGGVDDDDPDKPLTTADVDFLDPLDE